MTLSWGPDKIYIDDAGWGPEAGSIEYGPRVPFGGIHVFIGSIITLPSRMASAAASD